MKVNSSASTESGVRREENLVVGGAIGDVDSNHGAATSATDFGAVLSALNEHSAGPHLPLDLVPASSAIRLALAPVVARLHHLASQRPSGGTNSRVSKGIY